MQSGGAVAIGSFPITFGTSETIARIMMAVAVIIAVVSIVLSLLSMGKLSFG